MFSVEMRNCLRPLGPVSVLELLDGAVDMLYSLNCLCFGFSSGVDFLERTNFEYSGGFRRNGGYLLKIGWK